MDVICDYNSSFEHLFELDQQYRFYVERGGAGSGKSYATAQAIIKSCLHDVKGERRWLAIRKVRSTIRHSIWDLLRHIIQDMKVDSLFIESMYRLSFRCVTGTEIICSGLDDPEKLKSIYGITNIWIEEAPELTSEDFRQLDLRLRGGTKSKHIILTFNPVSSFSWLKSEFYDTPKPNAHLNHTTYQDNNFIDEEYKQELQGLRDIDVYFYTVYTLGEWGVHGNRIFNNFVIEDFPYTGNELENTLRGVDFGYNHASVAIKIGFLDGELYVYDELYLKHRTNQEFIEEMNDFDAEGKNNHLYTADSAEPARIKEFNQHGWAMEGAQKGKDSVQHGIDFLRRYKIHIHKSRCPNTAKEIKQYKYRETRDGQVLDEPVEINDDTIAALRYATEPLWRDIQKWRPVV